MESRKQSVLTRRIIPLWSALLLLFTFCLALLQCRAALQFDVFLGYDGLVPAASWFPVVCEVRNDSLAFTGTIEISPAGYRQGHVRRAIVELPTGTLKRIVVPVFSSSTYSSWDVRLLDQRGRIQSEQLSLRPRKQVAAVVPLMGALSRTAGGTPAFRPVLLQSQEFQPIAARLLPSIFPDNPVVLEGLRSIFLNSENAAELSVRQAAALNAWLHAGGHLIVGVEQISDVTSSPWLNRLLPVEPQEIRTVREHPELQQWLRTASAPVSPREIFSTRKKLGSTTLQPGANPLTDLPDDAHFETAELQIVAGRLRDGRALVSAGEFPLIASARRGEGQVTALLFNPEREPVRSWINLPTFWAKLAGVPSEWYVSSDFQQPSGWGSDGIFGAMIDSRQVHKLPVIWLLLMLVVYLAVIGPIDRFWLKRIGKPMLTWITFPGYVVFFSLLIYYIGFRLRAGESEWNELHVVDVLRNGEHAELRGRTFASVYSPSNERYVLESSQKVATLRGEFVGVWSGGLPGERAAITQNGDSFKAEVSVPVWSSQLYISDWWDSGALPAKVSVIPNDDGWRTVIENRTARDLTNAHLVVQRFIFKLPMIPANQTKELKLDKRQGTLLADFMSTNTGRFSAAVQSRQHAFGTSGEGRLDNLPGGTLAASFLSQMPHRSQAVGGFTCPPGLDLSPVIESGGAVLFAWVADYSPVRPIHQFTPRRSQKNTMWRIVVDSL